MTHGTCVLWSCLQSGCHTAKKMGIPLFKNHNQSDKLCVKAKNWHLAGVPG